MPVSVENHLVYKVDGVHVIWVNGAVAITVDGDTLLLDAPPGVARDLDALGLLPSIRSVACSSGKIESVGGLLPLLVEMERYQSRAFPFTVRAPMGDERPGLMAEAWSRGWPDRFPIGLDILVPGTGFEMFGAEIQTLGIELGEPLRGETPSIRSNVGVAWRVKTETHSIVWAKSCVPSMALQKFCKNVSLAIIEVAVQPWPKSDRRWRLSHQQASEYGLLAQELWLVGDEGGPLLFDLLN